MIWAISRPISACNGSGEDFDILKSHGRYAYSAIAHRPDYSFPEAKRLAVHLSLNLEHFAFGEELGNDYGAPQAHPNTATLGAITETASGPGVYWSLRTNMRCRSSF